MEWLIGSLPGPLGIKLRYWYWKQRLRFIGKNVRFGRGVRIYAPEWVSIGDHCWIDDYVVIIAGHLNLTSPFVRRHPIPEYRIQEGEVVVGDRTHIAPYVLLQGHGGLWIGSDLTIAAGAKVYSLSHHHLDLTGQADPGTVMKFSGLSSPEEQALICATTVIEDGAAVGLNSVVLPGAKIGKNSWLGALSLLKSELPPYVIAVGIPARIIQHRLFTKID
jgi:acetyltransferase-like isoleucine patch superfamily enzyme